MKANNYDLEQGISTFSGSVLNRRRRALPKIRAAQNMYNIFMVRNGLHLGNASERWKKVSATERATYTQLAAEDKLRFQRETAEREALLNKLAQKDVRDAIEQAKDEAHAERDAEQAAVDKAAARKQARTNNSTRRTSSMSAERKAISDHNRMVKGECTQREIKQTAYLSQHCDAMRPFVGNQLLEKLGLGPANAPKNKHKGVATPHADPAVVPQLLTNTPDYIHNGKLRDYQLRGVNWLLAMHNRGTNAILADEMGLGKTLQTITFLSYLKYELGMVGPSLVVVPLSVLTAWCNEFKRWSPTMRVMQFHSSDAGDRDRMRQKLARDPLCLDVVLTTYDMMVSQVSRYALSQQLRWRYVIMDEGHKIKNEDSGISQQMRRVMSEGRIILTGTPLQNNLHELWALLQYLVPPLFIEPKVFDNAFDLTHNICDATVLDQAHHLLRVFQLRRLKAEVEKLMPSKHEMNLIVKLSPAQKFWAKRLLLRDARILAQVEADLSGTGLDGDKDSDDDADADDTHDAWKRLNSLLMQMRKVCNHPYLLPGADPAADATSGVVGGTDESIVTASSKMLLLDRLLARLFAAGNRVVLFSQFTSMLDIFEDYLTMRGYKYVRLDGSCSRTKRNLDLRVFNAEG